MGKYAVVCYTGFGGNGEAEVMQGYGTLAEAREGLAYWSKVAIDEYDDAVMGMIYVNADDDWRIYGEDR